MSDGIENAMLPSVATSTSSRSSISGLTTKRLTSTLLKIINYFNVMNLTSKETRTRIQHSSATLFSRFIIIPCCQHCFLDFFFSRMITKLARAIEMFSHHRSTIKEVAVTFWAYGLLLIKFSNSLRRLHLPGLIQLVVGVTGPKFI
jgi:hypothetical protein